MTKANDLPKFDYLRAVYEDGTCTPWVNLAKPKFLIRWERENPDSPTPVTIVDQMRFTHMALGITDAFEAWAEKVEGLESREFVSGKANA